MNPADDAASEPTDFLLFRPFRRSGFVRSVPAGSRAATDRLVCYGLALAAFLAVGAVGRTAAADDVEGRTSGGGTASASPRFVSPPTYDAQSDDTPPPTAPHAVEEKPGTAAEPGTTAGSASVADHPTRKPWRERLQEAVGNWATKYLWTWDPTDSIHICLGISGGIAGVVAAYATAEAMVSRNGGWFYVQDTSSAKLVGKPLVDNKNRPLELPTTDQEGVTNVRKYTAKKGGYDRQFAEVTYANGRTVVLEWKAPFAKSQATGCATLNFLGGEVNGYLKPSVGPDGVPRRFYGGFNLGWVTASSDHPLHGSKSVSCFVPQVGGAAFGRSPDRGLLKLYIPLLPGSPLTPMIIIEYSSARLFNHPRLNEWSDRLNGAVEYAQNSIVQAAKWTWNKPLAPLHQPARIVGDYGKQLAASASARTVRIRRATLAATRQVARAPHAFVKAWNYHLAPREHDNVRPIGGGRGELAMGMGL